jgi:hypothetical protein
MPIVSARVGISKGGLGPANTSKQTYAVVQLAAHGWGPDQFGCLNSIWVRESGWNELG